ncbi:CsbD family protein [Sanyastnella coralliicola]|uniref:CsbD family protein n=1 Tax=Sanyastnella coralliicola TaxID=3069118 RepID=UPI0027BAF5F7|nr:CsbD family protein [Longitalea sp. SCSIO 12813]
MNNTQVEAKWQIAKGKLKQKYGDLIDDEIMRAEGATDEVIGKLRDKLGKSKEELRNELNTMLK